MHQIIQYIKFLLKSTNQHGVHSPFVYNLVTLCFYDKKKYPAYKIILNYKKQLLNNKNFIDVTDFGAGSKVNKQTKRQISEIAKYASTTNRRAKLLFRVVNYFKPNTILELGTSLGFATQAISLGHKEGNITTVEGCPNLSKFTASLFNTYNLKNISLITANLDTEVEKLKQNTFDLIFFDGNHQKEATLNYFETLLNSAHNNSVFIFDDIYWSKGMTEAWETIKQHPKVTVTIDTFFWGFVFFRKEQVKEHFVIRT
ncbi:methyltransferase [Tamlana nanhaiensis]|uniref:Methyltransferase n=1 Tax=Neotamlana nanhaiensis TaxID=1382798 RepID=A0A0D7W2N8_9FLAO|nr:class I SAM-dependent methyltransferase [Tamlana nanhaiensis]KJD33385.1 methyltransferase [Tamlana nanhaiensis]